MRERDREKETERETEKQRKRLKQLNKEKQRHRERDKRLTQLEPQDWKQCHGWAARVGRMVCREPWNSASNLPPPPTRMSSQFFLNYSLD